MALSASGELDDAGRRAYPLIGVMFGFPLIAAALLAALSPAARKAMLGAPLPLLVGLNTFRVFGLFFLLLEGGGRLGGPFPFSAGWGDIITGVLAVPAAMQHLPWSLIPTVLVPFYLIFHGIIFAQLRARSAAGTGRAAVGAG